VPQRLVSDERLVVLMRRGDGGAFESLYDRHVVELLSFCFFMLGSREDAEDAVQSTFASAHRALLRDDRSIDVRPWLYAIARNMCIGILRKRRPQEVELVARIAGEDVLAKVERRESVRQLLSGMLELPEHHRTALVLAELHGQSQREIGQLLGVPPSTVKSYIFQARATLTSERAARETDCREIREELVAARGAALLRGRLRRHLRSCAGCRAYAHDVSHRRRELGALLPLLPTLALKRRVLDATAGQATGAGVCVGGAGAGVTLSGAIEFGGAGAKTLLAKVLIAATGLGAGASAGTLVLGVASSQPVGPRAQLALVRDSADGQSAPSPDGASGAIASGSAGAGLPLARSSAPVGEPAAGGGKGSGSGAARAGQTDHARAVAAGSNGAGNGSGGAHGDNGAGNGKAHGAKANGNSAEHGNSAAAHAGAKGKSAEHGHSSEHGNSASHGNQARHGKSQSRGNAAGKGNAASKGSSTGDGNGRAVGHANSPASPGTAAHGNSAGHAPAAQPAHEAGAPAAQGQGSASSGVSSGHAKGNEQPPGRPSAVEEQQHALPSEAQPASGSSAEHTAAGEHEAPGHGASKA
jgi:RNA polymerase sigma factor (sigma-70 family)